MVSALKAILIDYVFDVTSAKEFSGPTGAFRVWDSKDVSYALTKFSILEEDVDVVGYVNLPASELEILDPWVAIFLCASLFNVPRRSLITHIADNGSRLLGK
jgi:hypothetical protein